VNSVHAIVFDGGVLRLLDQRVLPRELSWVRCTTAAEAAAAIRDMVVRGAPALSIAAAYGLALDAERGADLRVANEVLLAARPTAVNLRWVLERLRAVPRSELLAEARRIHAEDAAINRAMGDHGAAVLPEHPVVYHHCNTGALATGGWGTALGVVRSVHAQGRRVHVYVGETRPYLQGARLTAWECQQEGIPCTLVTDSTAAVVLPRCDAVLVGCDRVAANGDAANKIGTLGLAILARHYGVPFYVVMPTSTLDRRCADGASIPIEQRGAEEVLGHAGVRWAAEVPVFNPAFDVTPAELITGWVTERGVWRPPFPGP
jgi:methylthioribose-1-phosphate isomerase